MLAREGGGEEAAQRGVEFSFVWERLESSSVPGRAPVPASRTVKLASPDALGSLSFLPTPTCRALSRVSVPLPTSAKQEETFLEEQEDRQNFVLGHKTPPAPHSIAFTP